MNTGKYVFTQVTEFLPLNEFVKCGTRFRGNYQVKHFTCWHQLMCMLFGQLSNRESLSDLVTCLESQMGTGLSKSNLAYANEHRDWRIFAEYAYVIIGHARKTCLSSNEFDVDIDGQVYAIDFTTIDLFLSV